MNLASQGIIVNGILASPADTKSFRAIPGTEQALHGAQTRLPIGRVVQSEDVASAVAFLVSNEASMMCGQFLVVDAGCAVVG